jgi:hypothetical protein
MEEVFYFTGTRAQLAALLVDLNTGATFVEGEKTFKVTVEDLSTEAVTEPLTDEQADLPFETETAKPAGDTK